MNSESGNINFSLSSHYSVDGLKQITSLLSIFIYKENIFDLLPGISFYWLRNYWPLRYNISQILMNMTTPVSWLGFLKASWSFSLHHTSNRPKPIHIDHCCWKYKKSCRAILQDTLRNFSKLECYYLNRFYVFSCYANSFSLFYSLLLFITLIP